MFQPVWRLPRTRKKQSPKRILCNQRLLLPKLTDGPMTVLTPLKSMDNAEMPFMKNIVSEVVTQNTGQHDSVEGEKVILCLLLVCTELEYDWYGL